jgi:hypothetical protein
VGRFCRLYRFLSAVPSIFCGSLHSWHGGGHRFDPGKVHQILPGKLTLDTFTPTGIAEVCWQIRPSWLCGRLLPVGSIAPFCVPFAVLRPSLQVPRNSLSPHDSPLMELSVMAAPCGITRIYAPVAIQQAHIQRLSSYEKMLDTPHHPCDCRSDYAVAPRSAVQVASPCSLVGTEVREHDPSTGSIGRSTPRSR